MAGRTLSSKKKALLCAKAAKDKKAEDIIILDVKNISSVADYFIICTAASGRQMKAIYENIDEAVSQEGEGFHHIEGLHDSRWMLMDCYDVVIHIFDEETRDYYGLERLWGDAPRVELIPKAARVRHVKAG